MVKYVDSENVEHIPTALSTFCVSFRRITLARFIIIPFYPYIALLNNDLQSLVVGYTSGDVSKIDIETGKIVSGKNLFMLVRICLPNLIDLLLLLLLVVVVPSDPFAGQ